MQRARRRGLRHRNPDMPTPHPNRLVTIVLALASAVGTGAADRDLHDYWDTRCRGCHGHAGAFARSTLRVDKGRLVGAHHATNLDQFLRNHYLTDELVAPVTAMLTAQVQTLPRFQTHCAGCHDSAAEFARRSLTLRAEVLTGKAGGRPVAETLREHGGLAPVDAAAMVDTLTRVLGEVGTPSEPRAVGR
jgi:mono/diheme cytochrome c family protein